MAPGPPPRITRLSWGTVEIDGGAIMVKDAKLWPGGARSWDWGETGTHHAPGVQPADVEELLENGADVVVLSRGQWDRLRVTPATLRRLDEAGVETHVMATVEAVERYNELRESRNVGALIHSTC